MMASEHASCDGLRVVILNQYYAPDVASTGHLLSELAEYLAREGAEPLSIDRLLE